MYRIEMRYIDNLVTNQVKERGVPAVVIENRIKEKKVHEQVQRKQERQIKRSFRKGKKTILPKKRNM